MFAAYQQNIFLMGTIVLSPSQMRTISEPFFIAVALEIIHPYLVITIWHFTIISAMCMFCTDIFHAEFSACNYTLALVEMIVAYRSPASLSLDFQSASDVQGMLAVVASAIAIDPGTLVAAGIVSSPSSSSMYLMIPEG
jgi:hypothetical protein